MEDDDLIPVTVHTENKESFAEKFRANFIYPFSKKRFYEQWKNAPTCVRFRLTNKCDEYCSRCFECSSPLNPLKTIPVEDVVFYSNIPNANYDGVFMTGGEWSLIYNEQPEYLRQIFDKLNLSNSSFYSLQTNARWTRGKNSEKILGDIKHIQTQLKQHNSELKLDTSVDRYRSQLCMEGVTKLIRDVASDPEFDNIKIRIMSCALDAKLTNESVLRPEFFEPYGIKLKFGTRSWTNMYFQVCYANNIRIVIHEESPTMSIGRAKENGFGYKIYYPQLQCYGLQPDNLQWELSFREDGMVKWHDWYDWDIMVPYKDANNQNKSLEQIKKELLDMAWRRNFRYNLKDKLLNLIPVYGAIRMAYIKKQIETSFDENRKKMILEVKRVNCL